VDEAEMVHLIQTGEISPGVLVCRQGAMNWLPAREHACFHVEVYPRSKVPSRPSAHQVDISIGAAPPSFAQTQGEISAPPVERKSSALPWVLAGGTVVIVGSIVAAVLYYVADAKKANGPFSMENGEPPVVVPTNPPPRKTDWRDLHEQRFGNTPVLAAELKTKREAMVQRIKASEEGDLIDNKVLDAMSDIPMELFCPADQWQNVYTDSPVPIGYEETISQPTLTAVMLTLLKVNRGDRVLELKTASGYQTALLAHMGAKVYSLETDRALGRVMSPTLNGLGFDNLHYEVGGDAYVGLPAQGPYDRIIATAAYPTPPIALFKQLKPGGRMIAPVGDVATGQKLMLYLKTPDGEMRQKDLLPVAFGMMPR